MIGPMAARRILGPLACSGMRPDSPLLVGLLHYYKMSETSGNRADIVGTNHWIDHNSIGYEAGIIGNAASLVSGSAQYFSASAPTPFVDGTARTVRLWFKLNAGHTSSTGTLWSIQDSAGGGSFKVVLYYSGSSPNKTIGCVIGTGGSGTSAGFFSSGEWHRLIYTFDGGTAHRVYRDGVASPIISITGNGSGGSTAGMYLGSSAAGYQWGASDEIAIASRVWSSDDMALDWNSGAGRTHPFS